MGVENITLNISVDGFEDFLTKSDRFIEKIKQITDAVQSLEESCASAGIKLEIYKDEEIR